MNLTALPAFAKNRIWMIRCVQHADPIAAVAAVLVPEARRPLLETILVTPQPAVQMGNFNAAQSNLKSNAPDAQLERISVTLLPLTSGQDADMLWSAHRDLADFRPCCTAQPAAGKYVSPAFTARHRLAPALCCSEDFSTPARASTARLPMNLL